MAGEQASLSHTRRERPPAECLQHAQPIQYTNTDTNTDANTDVITDTNTYANTDTKTMMLTAVYSCASELMIYRRQTELFSAGHTHLPWEFYTSDFRTRLQMAFLTRIHCTGGDYKLLTTVANIICSYLTVDPRHHFQFGFVGAYSLQ